MAISMNFFLFFLVKQLGLVSISNSKGNNHSEDYIDSRLIRSSSQKIEQGVGTENPKLIKHFILIKKSF